MVLYHSYTPPPPLATFVDVIWFYESVSASHAKERVLPDGSMELVINLREDVFQIYDRQNHHQFQSFRGTILCGAHSEFFIIDTASQESIMGVHFKPGGAFPFLARPADELHGVHVSLDALWSTDANALREQLLQAPTPDIKFRILEQALLKHVSQRLTHHPAVTFALHELQQVPHMRTLADITGSIGLSSRRFIQLFTEEVGLTPKLFCRLRRFQQALCLIEQGQPIEWPQIALSCGYFDQSHFIHDFRAFSGLNPSTYLSRHTQHRNHVPITV